MPTRRPLIAAQVQAIVVVMVVGLVGCSPAIGPASAPATATAGSVATVPPASTGPSPTPADPSPTVAGPDGPPEAVLAAEGGDPVTGQLGTYTWLDTGSDSPWLPGAPIAVGAGEPLTVALEQGAIGAWTARYVRASATGPEGAITLGEGAGDPAVAAPGPGAWTLELVVTFAAGAGTASYFWRLEVE
jgi:hypothetical protein